VVYVLVTYVLSCLGYHGIHCYQLCVLTEVDTLGKEMAVIILTVFTEVWTKIEDAVEHRANSTA